MTVILIELERTEDLEQIIRAARSSTPKTSAKPRLAHEAILTLDMVASSTLSKFGNQKAAEVKGELDVIVRACAARFGSNFIKGLGDGHFIVFQGEVDSIRCAAEILEGLKNHNDHAERPEFQIHVREGIAFGEVVIDEQNDRQGDAANLSKWLEGMSVETLIEDKANGGMSAHEFAVLKHDRILIDRRVESGLPPPLNDKVRYVGLLRLKGGGTEEAYLVHWRDIIQMRNSLICKCA